MTTQNIDIETVRKLSLAFPGATEEPHFEKPSFRIQKKIFATVDLKNNRACVKLTASDQDIFSLFDKTTIYPVPNKWGQQGWTFVELKTVRIAVLKDILAAAFCEVAPPKIVALYKQSNP
jgi:predicted DNA-binding protein (MmcQ/YjbR family)